MDLSIEFVMDIQTATAIRDAAEALGITGRASIGEIRHLYHEGIKQYHPDVTEDDAQSSHQRTVLLNESYNNLMNYCMNYQFSFQIEDLIQTTERTYSEIWKERFGDDPLWG
jgi:hypothetical protein